MENTFTQNYYSENQVENGGDDMIKPQEMTEFAQTNATETTETFETSNDYETLKQENEMLKQENEMLKQENTNIKFNIIKDKVMKKYDISDIDDKETILHKMTTYYIENEM